MSPPLLSVEHLDVSYDGAVQALRDVSLEVQAGSVVAVLGSHGAGKASLLRAVSRALGSYGGAVTRGTIRYQGEDLAGLDFTKTGESPTRKVFITKVDASAPAGLELLDTIEGPSAKSHTFG